MADPQIIAFRREQQQIRRDCAIMKLICKRQAAQMARQQEVSMQMRSRLIEQKILREHASACGQ